MEMKSIQAYVREDVEEDDGFDDITQVELWLTKQQYKPIKRQGEFCLPPIIHWRKAGIGYDDDFANTLLYEYTKSSTSSVHSTFCSNLMKQNV